MGSLFGDETQGVQSEEMDSIETENPEKIIVVRFKGYENIVPIHPVATITVSAQFMGQNLGESPKLAVVAVDSVDTADHDFHIRVDVSKPQDLDILLSQPVLLTVTEHVSQMTVFIDTSSIRAISLTSDGSMGLTRQSAAELADALDSSGEKFDRKGMPGKEQERTAKKAERKEKKVKGKSSKGSKGHKGNKSNKTSTKDKIKLKGRKNQEEAGDAPQEVQIPDSIVLGSCAVDLLPLLLGKSQFCEMYLIRRPVNQRTVDVNVPNIASIPRVKIEVVTLNNQHILPQMNMLYLTLESIYNIPDVMAWPEMRHRVAVSLPLSNSALEWFIFENGKYVKEKDFYNNKKWFNFPQNSSYDGSTNYRVERNTDKIRNKLMKDEDLEKLLSIDYPTPRIEFNCLKRNALTSKAAGEFLCQIQNHRVLPIEIYMSPVPPPPPPTDSELKMLAEKEAEGKNSEERDKKGKDKSSKASKKSKKSKKGKGSNDKKTKGEGTKGKSSRDSKFKVKEKVVEEKKKEEPFLHLMALVDVQTLLYPGIQSCRTTCQLRTYQAQEMRNFAGVKDSYFRPQPPKLEMEETTSEDKTEKVKGKKHKGKKESKKGSKASHKTKKSGKKSSKDKKSMEMSKDGKSEKSKGKKSEEKKSKGKKSKDSKKSKKSKKSAKKEKKDKSLLDDIDLGEHLPPPPPPPPEPSKPVFNEKGEPTFIIIEVEVHKPLVSVKPMEYLEAILDDILPPKPQLAKEMTYSNFGEDYYREVVRKLMEDLYQQYRQFLQDKEKCTCEREPEIDLLTYLRRTGTYQTYLASMTRAATILAKEKFKYTGDKSVGNREYQIYISEIYVYMVTEMNRVINELVFSGTDNLPDSSLQMSSNDALLLYGKEACELGAFILADRYYLERIQRDESNPDFWFDYGIFHMQMNRRETAIECVKEALNINRRHKNSLIMLGLLLNETPRFYIEAETCLLTVTLEHPRWVEGWVALRLLYEIQNNMEGIEICEDMARMYLNDPREVQDYFVVQDDLAWFTGIVPQTAKLRAAMLFIKMRLYGLAERAIALELRDHRAICSYLLAVIAYYKGNYFHALQHLVDAKHGYGFDYAIGGLTGHCLMQQRRPKDAFRQYKRILESYNHPEDLHMIFVRAASAAEQIGESQEARNLILHACKFSPTPYTWLGAGLLYLRQKDLLSAEECFTHSNLCDGQLPETWAYLALLNIQMDRLNEAELCYKQAMKNDLLKGKLYTKLVNVFEKTQFKEV